jgi:Sec-independent protein translocase protein TatA
MENNNPFASIELPGTGKTIGEVVEAFKKMFRAVADKLKDVFQRAWNVIKKVAFKDNDPKRNLYKEGLHMFLKTSKQQECLKQNRYNMKVKQPNRHKGLGFTPSYPR